MTAKMVVNMNSLLITTLKVRWNFLGSLLSFWMGSTQANPSNMNAAMPTNYGMPEMLSQVKPVLRAEDLSGLAVLSIGT